MGRKSLNGNDLLPNRLAGRQPSPRSSPTMADPNGRAMAGATPCLKPPCRTPQVVSGLRLSPNRLAGRRPSPRWSLTMAGLGSSFLKRGVIADSIAHRPVPVPFPEGKLFDRPGFAAPRLPWVRDIPTVPEPCRGSLHSATAEIGWCVGFRNGFGESNSARDPSRWRGSSHLLQR